MSDCIRRLAHLPRLAGAIALVILFILIACGNGDDDDPPPSNKWDEMKWDEGKWGAIPTPFNSTLIA